MPPSSQKRQRYATIMIRVTPAEKAEIEAGAKRDELPLATWVRRLALYIARQGRKT